MCLQYTFRVNVLKSTTSTYVQNMMENMILTLYLANCRILSQAEVDMSQAFNWCRATSSIIRWVNNLVAPQIYFIARIDFQDYIVSLL